MTSRFVLPLLLLGLAVGAQAEGAKDIKPGLWEIRHKTAMDGQQLPDMSEMLAKVPPEMRGQVQAMMEKNGAGVTDKGMTICITPEQAARQQFGADDQDGKCQVTDMKHEGNKTSMKMTCSDPQGEGETTVTRQTSEAWSSASRMTMMEDGQPHTMNSEMDARWLGADCGGVKPAGSGARNGKADKADKADKPNKPAQP